MRIFLLVLFCGILNFSIAQKTFVGDGISGADDWQTGSNWDPVNSPGVTGLGNPSLIIASDCEVGSPSNLVGLNFANANDSRSITIDAPLVVYGDVVFGNKAMDLIINSTMVIYGSLTLNNQFDMSSSGVLVVTGTFSKNGGGGASYSGTGIVYASSYNAGADNLVTGTTANGSDQQQYITDLQNDIDSLSAIDPNSYPGGSSLLTELITSLENVQNFVEDGGNNPLPVEMKSMSAYSLNNNIIINWETASEKNTERFEILKSNDGFYFTQLGTIDASGPLNSQSKYSYVDIVPFNGLNYYLIKSVDFDGFSEDFYLNPVLVENNWTVFPNPAKRGNLINIVGLESNTETEITIISTKGEIVYSGKLASDHNQVDVGFSLKEGIYICKITQNSISKNIIWSISSEN